ncbi:MAG: aldose 1-epimerase family protein [Ignavibacteria bacterium]|nr:aldose 1-epimerase family protein [Ignavibacteria bacterium]
MIQTIRSDTLEVSVDTFGAELASIRSLADGMEYLWQGDPAYWGRRAPILFPVVGKLSDGIVRFDGREYVLPQHGFARDEEFEPVEATVDTLSFRLHDRPELLKRYPFRFELTVRYQLTDGWITVTYEVHNPQNTPVWFSIGAHPGFACPMISGHAFEDYMLEFDEPEKCPRHLIDNGLIRQETEPFLNNQRLIHLDQQLFDNDAIVLKGMRSGGVTLKSPKTEKSVRVEFPGWPYLGIWSKPGGAPFLCIEPWYGIADSAGFRGELNEREGILRLEPDGVFRCDHRILIGV